MAVCDWILTYKNEIIKIAKIKDKEIIKMKLAMAQMQMTDDINHNLETSLRYCDRAKDSDLLFFPEIQLSPLGELEGRSKMVHIAQAQNFYEQDYYTPSEEGFQVFDTPFGKIGIVICYDRHLPESIRTSTLKGADLIWSLRENL